MKRMTLVLALSLAGCATAPTGGDPVLLDQLVTLEKQSWDAWKQRNGEFYSNFLSDDHVELGPFGPAGKTEVAKFVGSPACVVQSYAIDNFQVRRLAADVALLIYHAQQQTMCGNAPVPSPAWVSSLYVRREGRWQNALFQQSPSVK